MLPDPCFNLRLQPDGTHAESVVRLREVWPVDDLPRPLPADTESGGDLACSVEVTWHGGRLAMVQLVKPHLV